MLSSHFPLLTLSNFFSCVFLLKSEIYSKSSGKAVKIDHQASFNNFHVYTLNKEKATELTQIFSLEKYI